MREICERETRDEEERKPDDSPHRGLKARTRRNFERHVEERRRANHAEEKLADVCVCECLSVLEEVGLKNC